MRLIIVTASNDAYMPLLRGLLASLKPVINEAPFAKVGCLDVGLNIENRTLISNQNVDVVEPEWNLPVDPQIRESSPHLRAMTARPFLPDYFPGYDIYLWIDCDAWVQERFAVDWLFNAACGGALAIVPESDRAYTQRLVLGWRIHRLSLYYNLDFAWKIPGENYFNSGVFALAADAPHWERWGKHLEQGVNATGGRVICDQTALNGALWSESLPVHTLPSLCNWMCHLALPQLDLRAEKLCEPLTPYGTLGIVHLADDTKHRTFTFTDAQGEPIHRGLRCPMDIAS